MEEHTAVQTLFRKGRYKEALQKVEENQFSNDTEQFLAQCYKALILCLRGDMIRAEELILELKNQKPIHQDESFQFIILSLFTILTLIF